MNALLKAHRLLFSTTILMVTGFSPLLHAESEAFAYAEESISISPDAGLDFGDVMVGESSVRNVVILNSGSASIRIMALRLHGEGFDHTGALALPTELQPGERLGVDLEFTPVTMERLDGRMQIVTDASGTIEYAIRGRGVFPVLVVGRTSIDYGRVGTGESRLDSFMVRNGGTARLRNVVVELASDDASTFEIVSASEAFDLEPGGRRQILVRLRQQQTTGERRATIAIGADDRMSGSIDLSATIVEKTSRVAPDFITSGGIVFSLSPVVPNPASEHATFSISSGSSRDIAGVVMVIDMRGEIVATPFDGTIHAGRTETIRIDPRPLPSGLYRVVFRAAGRMVSTEMAVRK